MQLLLHKRFAVLLCQGQTSTLTLMQKLVEQIYVMHLQACCSASGGCPLVQ